MSRLRNSGTAAVVLFGGFVFLLAGGGEWVSTGERPDGPKAVQGTDIHSVDGGGEYDRDAFGRGWGDLDGDGCDTRDEVLARDAAAGTFGPDGCIDQVSIVDPYTGLRVDGRNEIDIDHVVSLADAWRSGADIWDPVRRWEFANDPGNLLAADDGVNQSKSDRGPDEWRPADPAAWCLYATTYTDVKRDYQLLSTPAELAALDELSEDC